MSEKQYEAKEAARMVLENALVQYKNASEIFGSREYEMAGDIEQALQNSGFANLKIILRMYN